MFLKKTIPLIIFAICCALLVSQHCYVSARRATFESNRTRYMSDTLRITEGVSPVLWIDPQYSYISNAKYFDLSGNGNHGIQDTVAYQPTVAPPGLSFDGTDDYVDVRNSTSLRTDQGTIIAWIKTSSVAASSQAIFSYGGASQASAFPGELIFRLIGDGYGNSLQIVQNSDGQSPINVVRTSYFVVTNTYYHVALTSNGTLWKIYVNGIEQNIVADNGANNGAWFNDTTVTSPDKFGIGALMVNGSWVAFFNGTIDEVRIYNRALSATQIQQLYLLGLPRHRQ